MITSFGAKLRRACVAALVCGGALAAVAAAGEPAGATPIPCQPGDVAVSVVNFNFLPDPTINTGQSVCWTNNSNTSHTVNSDTGVWTPSGNLSPGQTYRVTFGSAGTFNYYCALHGSLTSGMRGFIQVGGGGGGGTLSINDVSTTEGASGTVRALKFKVTLSQVATSDVTFKVTTANGTAVSPSDYKAIPGKTFKIAAGKSSVNVKVTVIGDNTVEPNETFTVTLSNPVGATITDGSGTGTIVNDD